MDCRQAEELLPAYALDALSPEEEASVEGHLEVCPWCPALLQQHLQVATALAQAAEPSPPPQGLRTSILRQVERQSLPRDRSARGLPRMAQVALGAAASVVVLLLSGIVAVGILTSRQMDDLQRENTALTVQVSQLAHKDEKIVDMFQEQRSVNYVMASLDLDRQVLPLQGGEEVPRAEGMLLIASQGGTGVLMVRGLEPSSRDNEYHVWLERDGHLFIVGRLSVDDTGWGTLTLWPEQPITFFRKVWVTAEAASSTSGPKGSPVLWGVIGPR